MIKSFYKDQQLTVYDTLINDLKSRFTNRDLVVISNELEELVIAGIHENYDRVQVLIKGIGYQTYKSVIEHENLN